MVLAAGTRLGPYEVLAPLGAGGMGEVYRARDPRLARDVALKVLPAAVSADPERLRRFELEAKAAGTLNHPGILAVFDLGEHDGIPFVVSELLEGETLRARLAGGGLPLRKALDYAIQVAEGLAAAHDRGIVHRDLKPENLFVTRDGRAKILDFGLAKVLAPLERQASIGDPTLTHGGTDAGVVLGTVGYMSPEQVRGLPADTRSDIFAFGSVVYEMLARRRAFQGDTAAETMTAILREEPPALQEVDASLPPALDHIVRRCLEKRPEERFQSARDVAFALEASLADPLRVAAQHFQSARDAALAIEALSSASLRTTPAAELPPFRRRLPRGIGVALAVLLAAVLGALAAQRVLRAPAPTFTQVSYRRGALFSARFAPDGQTIVYGAAWENRPVEIFSTRVGAVESRSLGLPSADILAISSNGEMAVVIDPIRQYGLLLDGKLARVPLAGGAPRVVAEGVCGAAWGPGGAQLAAVRRADDTFRLEFPIGRVLYESTSLINSPAVSPRGDLVAFVEVAPHDPALSRLAIVDLAGRQRALTPSVQGLRNPVWVEGGQEIWFSVVAGRHGSAAIQAITPAGRQRVVVDLPGQIEILDLSAGKQVLAVRQYFRASLFVHSPGGAHAVEASWLDSSNLADLSADGRVVVFSETMAGGGQNAGVYMRSTDGSPAVRLGEGRAWALSPDGSWVLATTQRGEHPQVQLLPTGAGEPRPVSSLVLDDFRGGSWLSDGRLVLAGTTPREGARLFLVDSDGRRAEAVGPAGLDLAFPLASHDGRSVAAQSAEGDVIVIPLQDGTPAAVAGVEPGEVPIQWARDNSSLYVYRPNEVPARVFQVDLLGGRRRLFRELDVVDRAGLQNRMTVALTPDGASSAYSFSRYLSDLFLVEGLR